MTASRTEPDGKVETMGMIVVGVDRSTEARTAWRFAVEEARSVKPGFRVHTLAEWARFRQSRATDPDTVHVLDDVSSSLEAQARARPVRSSSIDLERRDLGDRRDDEAAALRI